MALIKYMPNPQKRRGNNGGDRQRIIHDSKQTNVAFKRGRVIGQKFLKSTIYSKKMNYDEITLNLYTYKLNEIPGIVDAVVRGVVTDAPDLKRICFETGYGKPKKAVDIRKSVTHYLLVTLGYTQDRGGGPKTFKLLSDHANRIVIFPQEYNDYLREEVEREEKEQALVDAKNAKKEAKERKKRQKYFKHNKWKKNLKYPEPKKKRQVIYDSDDPNREIDPRFCTPGGEGEPVHNSQEVEHQHLDLGEEEDRNGGDDSSASAEVEETEEAFLRNFMNLQVMVQESQAQRAAMDKKGKRGRKGKKKQKPEMDIFDGAQNPHQKFKYEAPDAYRYKPIKPELMENNKNKNNNGRNQSSAFGADHDDYHAMKNVLKGSQNSKRAEWQCEFCSFQNSADEKLCRMCYNEKFELRYQKFMNVVNDNNRRNEEKKQDVEQQVKNAENDGRSRWTCSTCTFINSGDGEICAMCNTLDAEREKCLDEELTRDDHQKHRKRKKKNHHDAKKQTEVVVADSPRRSDLLSEHLVIKTEKVSNHRKQKRVKLQNPKQNANSHANGSNADKNKLYHSGKQSVNGQIAHINREWQAQVWKAHNEKQKQIDVLKNGGSVANAKSAQQSQNESQSASNKANKGNKQKKKKNRNDKKKRNETQNKKEKNPKQIQLNSTNKKRQWNEPSQFFGEFVPHNKGIENDNQREDNSKADIWNHSPPPEPRSPSNEQTAPSNRRRRRRQQQQQQRSAPAPAPDVDAGMQWVPTLTEMGFSAEKVMEALAATNCVGCNEALDYLMNNA